MADTKTEQPKETPPEDTPAFEGSLSSDVPVVAADGHVNLSAEDIKKRDRA